MIRAVGILLLLSAIGLGIGWPWFQLNYLVDRIAELEYPQVTQNKLEIQEVALTTSDNPVRLRFQAYYKVDGKLPPLKIPVKLEIFDREGALVGAFLSFPTSGFSQGPELPTVRGSQPIEFNVLNDGIHQVGLQLASNDNDGGIEQPDIDRITVAVIANAPEIDENHKALAAALGLAGGYLLIRGRRRKKRNDPEPPNPKWGRG